MKMGTAVVVQARLKLRATKLRKEKESMTDNQAQRKRLKARLDRDIASNDKAIQDITKRVADITTTIRVLEDVI